jgi:hypothetical protein
MYSRQRAIVEKCSESAEIPVFAASGLVCMRVFGTFGATVWMVKIKSWVVHSLPFKKLKARILSSLMASPLTMLVQAAEDPHPITCHGSAYSTEYA